MGREPPARPLKKPKFFSCHAHGSCYVCEMNSRMLAIGALVLLIVVGALGAVVFNKKMNLPIERHVPLELTDIPAESRVQFVQQWAILSDREDVLKTVIQKANLVEEFGVADEQAAMVELRERTRVELADDGLTLRTYANGIRKELELLNQVCGLLFHATRLKYLDLRGEISGAPGQ